MKKIKVAVLFGGKSTEHEVSLMSAESVIGNLDREKFDVIPVKIPKNGEFPLREILPSDVVFPVLHGIGGEDGSIQGFCETIGKPYVGCGIEASALALDKIASKQIWQSLHLPVPSFIFFDKLEWQKNSTTIMQKVDPPVFIKPANTGSSIGIAKVEKSENLKKAIEEALKYHDRIIVEDALEEIREIEVSVLGNDDLKISSPGEIIPAEEFYTYNAKYKLDSGLVYPAKISKRKAHEIQSLVSKAYKAIGCRGFARVDLFMKKPEGKIYLNEINTIPGFTKVSMFPKLMEASGITYKELLTKIILLALKK